MAGETIQGVDSSYDELMIPQARCLRSKGIKLFIQALTALPRTGLHQPAHRIANLRNAETANIATAGYLLIAPGLTGKQCVAEARRGIPMDVWKRLKFVAIDIEVYGLNDHQVLEAWREVERLGKRAVIYTSYNVWTTMIVPNNSSLLAREGYALWNASWDNRPDINFSRLPFGGWTRDQVIGEQWSGGTVICNQSVDQDTFYKYIIDDIGVGLPEPEPKPVVLGKTIVHNGDYFFAEVGMGAGTHHWYIRTHKELEAYRTIGWSQVSRKPLGSRLDW